jgi:beta-glucosidase
MAARDGIAMPDLDYRDGVAIGYKGYDVAGTAPLFPFGYGPTYTTFGYGRLRVRAPDPYDRHPRAVQVEFRIANTGSRAGTGTAQAYLGSPPVSVSRTGGWSATRR